MGDFDGDGFLDLSTANFGSNTASVLINDYNGDDAICWRPATARRRSG